MSINTRKIIGRKHQFNRSLRDYRKTNRTEQIAVVVSFCILLVVSVLVNRDTDWYSFKESLVLFSVLILLLLSTGTRSSLGVYVSMAPFAGISMALIVGYQPAALLFLLSGVLLSGIAYFLLPTVGMPKRFVPHGLLEMMAHTVNVAFSLLVFGAIYTWTGGGTGIATLSPGKFVRTIIFIFGLLTFIELNIVLGLYFLRGGKEGRHLQSYFTSHTRFILISVAGIAIMVPAFVDIYFHWSHIRWPSVFVATIGALIVNSDLRTHVLVSHRIADLKTLNSVGQALSSQLDMEDLVELIYAEVGKLLDVRGFYIALYDEAQNEVSFPILYRKGVRGHEEPRVAGKGFTELVISRKEPVLVTRGVFQFAKENGLEDTFDPNQDLSMLSYLGVPIIGGNEILGVLAIRSFEYTDNFTYEDVQLLETIASQAAIALNNARHHQQSLRQASELTSLNVISTLVSSSLNLDDVLKTICTAIIDIVGADKSAVFLLDKNRRYLHLVSHIGLSDEFVALSKTVDTTNNDRTAWMKAPQLLAIEDLQEHIKSIEGDIKVYQHVAETGGFNASIDVVLQIAGRAIGNITAYYDGPHQFTAEERELLRTLAGQTAIAVENARLFESTRKRQHELEVLYDASTVLSSALSTERVLETIGLTLSRALTSPQSLVLIYPTPGAGLSLQVHVRNQDGMAVVEPPEPDTGLKTIPALNGEDFSDAIEVKGDDDSLGEPLTDLLAHFEISSALVVPISVQRDTLGYVILEGQAEEHFDEDQKRLALTLVSQGAIVIQNARLFEFTEITLSDRLEEIALLEQVSQRMTRRLDLYAVLEQVVRAAAEATGATISEVLLLGETQIVALEDEQIEIEKINDDLFKTGVIGRALRTSEIQIVPDTTKDEDYKPFDDNIRSELVVPIILDARHLGVINLESQTRGAFSHDHARFINSLAEHAAVAIQNARLFETVQKRANEFDTLRRIGVDILSFPNLEGTLKIIAEATLEQTGACETSVYLYDEDTQKIKVGIRLSNKDNVDTVKLFEEINFVSSIADSGEALIIRNLKDHPLLADVAEEETERITSVIGLPLRRGKDIIGVFCVVYDNENDLNDEALRFLDLLNSQAAVAISDAQLVEETLAQRDRLQAILNSNNDGIMLFDVEGVLHIANPRLEWMLNVRASEFIGKHFKQILGSQNARISNESMFSRAKLDQLLAEIRENPYTHTRRSYTLNTPNFIAIEEISSPVTDSEDQIIGRIFVMRDMTHSYELEAYREELSQMLVHDLRSPLSGVISGLYMAMEEAVAEEMDMETLRATLEVALNSANLLLNLIENLLDINKLEGGEFSLKRDTVDLGEIVAESKNVLSAIAQDAQIMIDIEENTDPASVTGDAQILGRVITNLLDNAVRYTPHEGKIKIVIDEAENAYQVSVVDSGEGIPEEYRESIFERFVQVNVAKRKRGSKGSGLGLTFCKLAVEAHGGRIWVDEGKNGGSAFRFTIPKTPSPT